MLFLQTKIFVLSRAFCDEESDGDGNVPKFEVVFHFKVNVRVTVNVI